MTITESRIEETTLQWFRELGYTALHGPMFKHSEPAAVLDSFGEVVLAGRLREALGVRSQPFPRRRLQPTRNPCPFNATRKETEPMSKDSKTLPTGAQFLAYQAEDGKLKLEVRFEGEIVRLIQKHMVELFQTTKQNIGQHLKSAFAEGELVHDSVVKKYLTTAADQKNYAACFDNLVAITSVGAIG